MPWSVEHSQKEYVLKILKICFNFNNFLDAAKGQKKSKLADWRAVHSPKNRADELFAMKNKKVNKTNSSVRFLGEVSRPCIALKIN